MSLPASGLTPLPRFVARVTGERALEFLHDTTSQDLSQLRAGEGALTCVLDEKGGILAELRALVLGPSEVLVDGEEAARDAVFRRLARVAPLSGVEIEETGMSVTAVRGVSVDAPATEHAWVARGSSIVVRTGWDGDGADVLGPVNIDAPTVPFEDYDAARIAAGRPRFGVDIIPGMLINETPLVSRAVSFEKGCYPGQESVARVHNLGKIRRRFVLVSFDGSPPDVPSALDDGLGTLTSAARGFGIAVARATLDAGARVQTGEHKLTIERVLT